MLVRQGNGTWGVLVLGAVYNIFINKDLLAKADVLKTWNQSYAAMMDAAKKPRVTAYLAFRCASEQATSRSGTGVERYPMGADQTKNDYLFSHPTTDVDCGTGVCFCSASGFWHFEHHHARHHGRAGSFSGRRESCTTHY